jgi:membrane dipeptidase
MAKKFSIIDFHCDTASEMLDGRSLYENDGMISIQKLKAGNVFCQFFAMYIRMTDHASADAGFDHLQKIYRNFTAELAKNKEHIALALTAKDVSAIRGEGKIAGILTLEEGAVLNGKIERVDELYKMGVRLITISWNHENCNCYPHSSQPDLMKRGLKPFGKEVVGRMQELGMLVDVSHLSDGGFWDVAELSKKPFVASHSNARTLRDHTRNLTDEMLKKLADLGGITGINFFHKFLGTDETGSIAQMVDHVKHIHKTAGLDVLALGSDFDGFNGPCELSNCAQFPVLTDALVEAGYSEDDVEKICWKNAMRVIEQVL